MGQRGGVAATYRQGSRRKATDMGKEARKLVAALKAHAAGPCVGSAWIIGKRGAIHDRKAGQVRATDAFLLEAAGGKKAQARGLAELAAKRRDGAARPDKKAKESAARIRKDSGVTKCAALTTEKRGESADRPDQADKLKQTLRARRKDAIVFRLSRELKLLGKGLHMMLLDVAQNKTARCLVHHPASDAEALASLMKLKRSPS